jgi:hypothetical protein
MNRADLRAIDGNGAKMSSKFEHLCVSEEVTSLFAEPKKTLQASDVQVCQSDGSLKSQFGAVACS